MPTRSGLSQHLGTRLKVLEEVSFVSLIDWFIFIYFPPNY